MHYGEPCCEPVEYTDKDHVRDLQNENRQLYERLNAIEEMAARLRTENKQLRALLKEIL